MIYSSAILFRKMPDLIVCHQFFKAEIYFRFYVRDFLSFSY